MSVKIELKTKIVGTNPVHRRVAIFINDEERTDADISHPHTKGEDHYHLVSTSMMNEADGKGHYYIVKNGEFHKELCAADKPTWTRYV